MMNEEQLTVKEMKRRLTSLLSSAESLQSYLLKLCKMSGPSPDLLSGVVATSAYLSLMTAGAHVLQSEMDRLYWTNVSTRLQSLMEHWRTAYENLENWTDLTPQQSELFEECDCNE